MHSHEERARVLSTILQTAQVIAQHDPSCPAGQSAQEHLLFCLHHGYVGCPTDSHDRFLVGDYLDRGRVGPTTPTEARKSLGIIVCFSDEVMPCSPLRRHDEPTKSAYVSPENNILVIGYADWYAARELALKLLHEARHARQIFGGQFENLPPLDPDELHESQTWKYELDLLDAFGGNAWQNAVRQDMALLKQRYALRNRQPGEKFFAMSGQRYPELEQLFSISPHPAGADERYILVAMRANFLIAEEARLTDLDTAYANIVGAYYNWGK